MHSVSRTLWAYGGAVAGLIVALFASQRAASAPPYHCHAWTFDNGFSLVLFMLLAPLVFALTLRRSSLAVFGVGLVLTMVVFAISINWTTIVPCSPL